MNNEHKERARAWLACVHAAAMEPEGDIESLAGLLRETAEEQRRRDDAAIDRLHERLAVERERVERLRAVAEAAEDVGPLPSPAWDHEIEFHDRAFAALTAALAALHPGDLDGGDRA